MGTTVHVAGYDGLGVVCPGHRVAWIGGNTHSLRFDSGVQALPLRNLVWHVMTAPSPSEQFQALQPTTAVRRLAARGAADTRFAAAG
eukprot:COSAG02_NODE_64421_length_260_cov_1.248447_1_plen_86_part_11